jgi:peptidoglycan/LPS O-acetylase OafA/YrhL
MTVIFASFIIILFFPYWRGIPDIFILNYTMSAAFGALLIGLYLRPIQIVVNRVTVFFGLISYSLYLNHPQMIYYMSDVYKSIYNVIHFNFLAFLVSILITLIPLSILSIITYQIIEKPGIALGRRIIRTLKTKEGKSLKFI